MRALHFIALCLALAISGCAALRTGWARVEWMDGGVSPVVECTARVASDGEIDLTCRAVGKVETDLLWKREKKRALGGDT